MSEQLIKIKGAKEHNLKNVSLEIPKNKLIVFTGVSGSGKSSLAFNTIYSEGRRRYIESLSSYARQFLKISEKADVESIEGLTPSISIEQKTINNNPRSTVGTTTEIFDYLRLLYARIGTIMCVNGHGKIQNITVSEIFDKIKVTTAIGNRIIVLAPIVVLEKGNHLELINRLRKEGIRRLNINGEILGINSIINLDENKKNSIDIVIDRLIFEHDLETQSRFFEALENSLNYNKDLIKVYNFDLNEVFLFSQNFSCIKCNFSILNLEPRIFSFNSPSGACKKCNGIGMCLEVDWDLLAPNKSLSIIEGGIKYLKSGMDSQNIDWKKFMVLVNYYDIPTNIAIKNFSKEQIDIILNGSKQSIKYKMDVNGGWIEKNEFIEGVAELIQRRYVQTKSERQREIYHSYLTNKTCISCNGKRLSKESLSVFVGDKNIIELTELSLDKILFYLKSLVLTDKELQITKLILSEIINRLTFLIDLGLNYLSLSRQNSTLSGGEAQRIRLATQIGSKLSGVLYVLDEPSIGLHQSDNNKLINTLKNLRDINNTVIVVEHDEETIRSADWLVDIGPKAGVHGGEVVYNGIPENIYKANNSLTADYLYARKKIEIPKTRRTGNGKYLEIFNAYENNLKNINVKIPLHKFVCITGVSGSGKSTLINEILYKYINNKINNNNEKVGKVNSIIGIENIDKIIKISQSPIGRTPRSNPATYTSVFDDIRDLFASTNEAQIRGYEKGRFSFNVSGGRCEKCFGDGFLRISMYFLPDVYIACEECKSKRYNKETLTIKFKNKNIADILNLTIDEACIFFENQKKIMDKLNIMKEVGLGYIKLGQPAPQLSGGEAQRVKLATYLQKKPTGKTLFILDEPTTGLHIHDVSKLLKSLNKILNKGDSVIVIEHNLDVIKSADYIIDLGPLGGSDGGQVIACGSPEEIANNKQSLTGQYIKF